MIVVVLCAYGRSLRAELVYDDLTDIVQNTYVRTFDVRGIFTSPSWATWVGVGYSGYRPLTTLTFAANHWFHGPRPFGYHAVNVLLHAAFSIVVAVFVGRLTGRPRVGWLTGLLFAAHPVHTDAVASVVGRAEELAALFAVGAWWLVLESRSGPTPRAAWLALAGICVAAGTLAKESAATIVLAVAAVDALSRRPADRERRPTLRRVLEYGVLLGGAAAAIAVRTTVMGGMANNVVVKMDNPLVDQAAAVRLWTTLRVIAAYARLLLWPVHLSADYSYRQVEIAGAPFAADVLAGLGVVVALGLAAAWASRRAPDVSVGVAILATTASLSLAATFLSVGPIMGERLLYLPSVGFCLLVGGAFDRLWAWRGRAGRAIAVAGVATLLGGYVLRTAARNAVWQDRRTFAEALVADAPMSARSHRELGIVYGDLGQHDQAVRELLLSRGIVMHPSTSYDLGNVLLAAGRYPDAVRAYEEAVALKPDLLEAMTNLATAYSNQGDEETAERWLRRVLDLNGDWADARLNLANGMLRRGRLEEAAAQYREVIQRAPADGLARMNYGVCLEALGRPGEAAEQYRMAIRLAPPSPQSHVRLVAALLSAGLTNDARIAQGDAERLFPTDPGVRESRRLFAGR